MAASLVGGYGSESDEDETTPSVTEKGGNGSNEGKSVWTECFDDSTGFSYYWNTQTNEVSWDRPPEMTAKKVPVPISSTKKEDLKKNGSSNKKLITQYPVNESPPIAESKKKKKVVGSSSSATTNSSRTKVFFGPALPEPKPEEIAKQKILKFETEMKEGIIRNIEKETPLDWYDTMPRALHVQPFQWDQKSKLLPTWKEMVKEKSKVAPTNSISLIAGEYGDTDEEEEEEVSGQKESPLRPGKRKLQMQVKSQSTAKLAKKESMKNVSVIFKDDDEEEEDECKKNLSKTSSRTTQKGASFKKSIDDVAEVLCDKLEILNVASIDISPLKLLAVQVETLFAAWQSSAISPSYLQKILFDLSQRMKQIEARDLAPPGWKAIWDRTEKKYSYENLITGESQDTNPKDEETEDEEDQETEDNDINNKESSTNSISEVQPPLPGPSLPTEMPPLPSSEPPPLPPPPPPPPPLPPTPEEVMPVTLPPAPVAVIQQPPFPVINPADGVQDMDLDEEEEESSEVVQRTDDMNDALSSFYASLGGAHTTESTPQSTPREGNSPAPTGASTTTASPLVQFEGEGSCSPRQLVNNDEERNNKKKRTKFSGSLAIKKKGVDNLVAKWQNIQDEVKRTK